MTDYILPHDLERKITVLSEGLEKLRNDDIDGAMEKLSKIQLTAGNLAFMKEVRGADFIRANNFDTTRADKEYGHDWLNK